MIAVAVIFGVYYGINEHAKLPNPFPETTVTKAPATEIHGNKELIASLTSEDILLYRDGDTIILSFKGKTQEFDNWGKKFDSEPLEIHYANFDDDKAKEIVIRGVDYKSDNGETVYCLYYLDPVKNKDGETVFSVSYLDRNNWISIVDVMLQEKLTQLTNYKKIAQFSINYANTYITYDKETGLATNGYSGYFSALADKNGQYMTIEKWSKGAGIYSISADNKIFIDIPVIVSYKNSGDIQRAGSIHFQIIKNKSGGMAVASKSLVFVPETEYRVSNPTTYTSTPWSYTEKNSDITIDKDKTNIEWIKYSPAFNSATTLQTLSYGALDSDIKNISKVVLTESYIELFAKKGCKFSNSADKSEFSVIINDGQSDSFDISYTAQVTVNSKGNEVLRIYFDKKYPQSEIKTIQVIYGAK